MYDIIIIGAGPAGLSAGWHAQKNRLKVLVIAKDVWLPQTADEVLVMDFSAIIAEVKKAEVINLDKNIVSFSLETKDGKQYFARSVIIASGAAGDEGNTGFDRLTLKDAYNKIVVDANMQSNVPGLLAAGDVAVTLAKGLASAILEGGKAALTLDKILKKGDNKA
jgi:thioredoxin reductase (NADPH)